MLTVKDAFPLVRGHQREGENAPMKVKIIRNTVADGKAVNVGDVVELPEREAKELIVMKRAVEFKEEAKAPKPEPAPEPMIETAVIPQDFETAVKPRPKRKEK
jgi:hypothetical protein